MKKSKKMICIILSLVMVLSLNSFLHTRASKVTTNDISFTEEGVSVIAPENIIDALTLEELESHDCIKRIPEMEEDLYSVVYQCADGNYATYIFQHPIKYVDSNGKIKDINTSIKSSHSIIQNDNIQNNAIARLQAEYAFSSEENSIKVFYSDDLSNTTSAIVATNSNWTIGLAPYIPSQKYNTISTVLHSNNYAHLNAEESATNSIFTGIEYSRVFDDNISLHYHTTYTGYKELIEIKSPIDETSFQFVLSTGGLHPQLSESGQIELIDPSTNQNIANFAPLYVYDSSESPIYTINNTYIIEPLKESIGLYLITLEIDNDYLTDNNITYPVFVDPTFSFDTSSAINDAPIYSGIPSSAQGSNYYNHIGYIDSSYGTGSLLVKFPALKENEMFNGLTDTRINSVTYNVRKVGGNNSLSSTLEAYHYTGSSWDEASITFNSAAIDSYTGSFVSSVSMKAHTWYSFDITSAAIDWKNGDSNYDSGLLITNATSTTENIYERVLASVEYGSSINSSYMPYLTVVYNNEDTSAGFSTPDLAAKDFAESVYSSCEYVLIEYAATIYYLNGQYYYYNVHGGNPHDVTVSKSVPYGATFIAFIHTHPNSEYFSDQDINVARYFEGNAYVVTPSYRILGYDYDENAISLIFSNLTINPLTSLEKETLVSTYTSIWNGHFVDGVCSSGFDCHNKTWPNE